MTLTQLTGFVPFKVAGQSALGPWAQKAIRAALDSIDSPPESLRFQCRIAIDAQENLSLVNLPDGETLTLHAQARPQFGKNRDGHAFLTVTMIYSGDGLGYRLRWIGNAVPLKMQEVAVKHDQGLAVKPTLIGLDLSKAEITPSWKVKGGSGPYKDARNNAKEVANAAARRGDKPKVSRGKRNCARLTVEDLRK